MEVTGAPRGHDLAAGTRVEPSCVAAPRLQQHSSAPPSCSEDCMIGRAASRCAASFRYVPSRSSSSCFLLKLFLLLLLVQGVPVHQVLVPFSLLSLKYLRGRWSCRRPSPSAARARRGAPSSPRRRSAATRQTHITARQCFCRYCVCEHHHHAGRVAREPAGAAGDARGAAAVARPPPQISHLYRRVASSISEAPPRHTMSSLEMQCHIQIYILSIVQSFRVTMSTEPTWCAQNPVDASHLRLYVV